MDDYKHNKYYDPSFWDNFYGSIKQENYDWFFDFSSLNINEFKLKNLNKDARILLLGVGYSSITNILNAQKYKYVDIIDFSSDVTKYLSSKYKSNKDWHIMTEDIVHYKSHIKNIYDVIIDKCCIDCILTDPEDGDKKFVIALNNIRNLLNDTGILYYFSYADIADRINYFYEVNNIKYEYYQIPQSSFVQDDNYEYDDEDNCYSLFIIKKLKH